MRGAPERSGALFFFLKNKKPLFEFAGSSGGAVRVRLTASYFLCKQKVTKELFRGENTDSTSGAKGAALAHSIFPLKTPVFYGGAFIKCSVLLTGAG